MSSFHQVLHYATGTSPSPKTWRSIAFRLFHDRRKTLWMLIAALTCIAELIPLSPMPLKLFALYTVTKVSLSFALGFIIPLAFYHLNGIGASLALSCVTTLLVEIVQGMWANGHSFHWLEFAGKLVLIALGFAIALTRRYESRISPKPVDVRLQTGQLG